MTHHGVATNFGAASAVALVPLRKEQRRDRQQGASEAVLEGDADGVAGQPQQRDAARHATQAAAVHVLGRHVAHLHEHTPCR